MPISLKLYSCAFILHVVLFISKDLHSNSELFSSWCVRHWDTTVPLFQYNASSSSREAQLTYGRNGRIFWLNLMEEPSSQTSLSLKTILLQLDAHMRGWRENRTSSQKIKLLKFITYTEIISNLGNTELENVRERWHIRITWTLNTVLINYLL